MTDLEYDLDLAAEFGSGFMPESDDDGIDFEATAKNLSKMGYHKIKWHKVSEGDFPHTGTRVLGYYVKDGHGLYDFCYYGFPVKSKFARITVWGDSQLVEVLAWMEIPEYKE